MLQPVTTCYGGYWNEKWDGNCLFDGKVRTTFATENTSTSSTSKIFSLWKKQKLTGEDSKKFRKEDFDVSEEVLNHLSYRNNELLVVIGFQDIWNKNGQLKIILNCKGFEEEEND